MLHQAMSRKAGPTPVNKIGAMRNVKRNLASTIYRPKYMGKNVATMTKK